MLPALMRPLVTVPLAVTPMMLLGYSLTHLEPEEPGRVWLDCSTELGIMLDHVPVAEPPECQCTGSLTDSVSRVVHC